MSEIHQQVCEKTHRAYPKFVLGRGTGSRAREGKSASEAGGMRVMGVVCGLNGALRLCARLGITDIRLHFGLDKGGWAWEGGHGKEDEDWGLVRIRVLGGV